MKRIQHNDFKLYTPPGVASTLTTYCQHNSIYKSQARDFYKYIFIVSHITTHSLYEKNERDSCQINLKTLSKILGTKDGETTKMLKNLVNLKVIKKVRNHQVGVKSSAYTIVNKNTDWEEIIAESKYTLIPSKIIEKRNALRSNPSNNLKMYKKCISNITVDIPADYYSTWDSTGGNDEKKFSYTYSSLTTYPSTSYSSPTYSTSPINIPLMLGEYSYNTALVEDTDDFTKVFCTTQKVNSYILSLEAIKQGNWFVLRPDKESRVHTNLTNLKREFRYFLRYKEKSLVELDIRNSQPLIASILINGYWLKKGKLIPADVIGYQQDCEAGIFYDYFMELNNILEENRGEFKIQMFSELFFSKVSKRKTRLKKQFIAKYPNAYQAICDIKGGYGSKTYNQFSIQLQRKEASIIFDNVNMKLLRQGIPAFNIFDSILCLKEHQGIAKKELLEGFAAFKITPTINYKNYDTPLKT